MVSPRHAVEKCVLVVLSNGHPHYLLNPGFFISVCGLETELDCTVNVTGETLVLNKNFSSRKQGFTQHQAGTVGQSGLAPA